MTLWLLWIHIASQLLGRTIQRSWLETREDVNAVRLFAHRPGVQTLVSQRLRVFDCGSVRGGCIDFRYMVKANLGDFEV